MKLLILGQTPPPYGGQAINIRKMISILDEQEFNYRFIRLAFSDEINDMGRLSIKKGLRLPVTFFKLLWQLCIYRPDAVYYPPAGPSITPVIRDMILLFPVRLFRFKVVYHYHAGGLSDLYEQLSWPIKIIYRFVYFSADYSICLSEKGLHDPMKLRSQNNVIIPTGVEDPGMPIHQKSSNSFIVLFAGLCSRSKGIMDFIDILRYAKKVNPAIQGRILGKTFSAEEEAAIRTAEQEEILVYEGVQTGTVKQDHFKKAHVFLFPSFFEAENFPTVILEAFAAGLPVIASDWRGIPDQVINDHNGFVCNVHDTTAMAQHILQLSNDVTLYKRLSANARHDFETKYTMGNFAQSVTSFFNTIK